MEQVKDKICLVKHALAQYVGKLQFDPRQPGQIVITEGCLLQTIKGSPAKGQANQMFFSFVKLKTPAILNGSSIVQEIEESGEMYNKYLEAMTEIIPAKPGDVPRIH